MIKEENFSEKYYSVRTDVQKDGSQTVIYLINNGFYYIQYLLLDKNRSTKINHRGGDNVDESTGKDRFLKILMPWLMNVKNGKSTQNRKAIGSGLHNDLVMIFHQDWAVMAAR